MIISGLISRLFLLSAITMSLHLNAMDDLQNIKQPISEQNNNNNLNTITFDNNSNTIQEQQSTSNINIINNENDNINNIFEEIVMDCKHKNYNNKQVFNEKLEKVVKELKTIANPKIKQDDLLLWVKYAREELPNHKIKSYSKQRAPYEKSLKKLNIIKHNVPKYQQPNFQQFLNNKILETKRKRAELNTDYYQDVVDMKGNLVSKLSDKSNLNCTLNDISLNTIKHLLLHNSNNIVKGIGFDTKHKKTYNSKMRTHYKYGPINGIEQMPCYDYISEILKSTYDVKYNEIMEDYEVPVYNIVKYGLVIPCVNDFINNISENASSEESLEEEVENSGWISIFKPLNIANQYLLTIIDTNTNNTLKLKLNVENNNINIDLDTLFCDDERSVKLQNEKNKSYYEKQYDKQSNKQLSKNK